jgi:hypothetical protein
MLSHVPSPFPSLSPSKFLHPYACMAQTWLQDVLSLPACNTQSLLLLIHEIQGYCSDSCSGKNQHAAQQKFTDTRTKGGSHSSSAVEASLLVCDAVSLGK